MNYSITGREANLIHQALLRERINMQAEIEVCKIKGWETMQPFYAEWTQECKELAMRFEKQAEAYAWRTLKEGEKND